MYTRCIKHIYTDKPYPFLNKVWVDITYDTVTGKREQIIHSGKATFTIPDDDGPKNEMEEAFYKKYLGPATHKATLELVSDLTNDDEDCISYGRKLILAEKAQIGIVNRAMEESKEPKVSKQRKLAEYLESIGVHLERIVDKLPT